MIEWLKQPWPWCVAGPLLGLIVSIASAIAGPGPMEYFDPSFRTNR